MRWSKADTRGRVRCHARWVRVDPVPYRAWDGICDLCCGESGEYALCRSCRKHTLALGVQPSEVSVFPLGLAMKRSPLAIALWRYKRADSGSDRSEAVDLLRDVIDERLPLIASHIPEYDVVTFVPGRKSRASTVRDLFSGTTWARENSIRSQLEVLDYDVDTHAADGRRFRSRPIHGNVLLLDDTFTSGATSFSAARALLNAGAHHVSIVVVGRHSDPGWLSDVYMGQVAERQADGEFCPDCFTGIANHESQLDGEPDDPFDSWGAPAPDPWASAGEMDPWASSWEMPEPAASAQRFSTPPVPPPTAATASPTVAGSISAGVKRGLKWIGFGLFAVVGVAMYIDQSTISVPNDHRMESGDDPVRDSAPGREAAIDRISANASEYDMGGVPRGPIAEGVEYVCTEYIAEGRDLSDYTSEMESLASDQTARDTLPFLNYIGEVVFEDSDVIC